MPTDTLVLLGAGGHAKVVFDAHRAARPHADVRVYDDDAAKQGMSFYGVDVETPIAPYGRFRCACHVAIGGNATRRRIALALESAGARLFTVIHPAATVAQTAESDRGAFIAAGVIIAPHARIGTGAIVNHAAVVDHECTVGNWCHIAAGAVLGGAVRVGEACLIGSGAIVLPGISIGEGAIVGAGAVVTRDIAAGVTVVGVPAREKHERR
jgi:sugar O-acyltransferase (sialic acid O-acetyltransferase NeuD family)